MIKKLSLRLSTNILLIIFTLGLIFHCCVITGVIPFSMVWGGRIETHSQMLVFESISIVLTLWILLLVLTKVQRIKPLFSRRFLSINFWVLTILFGLNTIGNLASFSSLETFLFTPITFGLSILCYRLTLADETTQL